MSRKIPIVSFFSFVSKSRRILENPLPFHRENFTKHGSIFKLSLGFGKHIIFTRDAGLTKHMLQTQHKKYHKSPIQTDDLGRYLGKGLLTSNGAFWLKQRRLIQPTFYKKKLETIKNVIVETVKLELKKIETNKTVDIFPLMNDLAFKVVGKSLFSYSNNESVINRLQHITETIQQDLVKEVRQPFKKWWFILNGEIKKTTALSNEARANIKSLIEERKNSGKTYNDLLDILLSTEYEDGSKMDIEQLIDEILILFVAGHETTSNALTFTLQLLAQNPEIQEQLFEEVKNLTSEDIGMKELFEKTSYTKKCIDEAMRLYPPAYFSDRVTIEDDTYEDYNFKKGTTLLISFYEIHRNKEFWKNPDTFNPTRFDAIPKKELANHYFPFGAGPRMCVGSNFAIYEMLVTVIEIIKHYKITPKFSEIKIKPLVTLKPINALLNFENRLSE